MNQRKFVRKRALKLVREILNGKSVYYADTDNDVDGEGSGRIINAINKVIDVENLNPGKLPILSVLPAPHTINVHLNGVSTDSNYRIAIFGFVNKSTSDEELFDAAEDVIETVVDLLTNEDNVRSMMDNDFSIVEFGPILDEQFDDKGNIAYISIPITIQFVER